ncbi:MAG: hypothetical protein L6V93_08390 [Clostridiales bacterium]|nr:MAG: hypothetical protein L6V93_08390 [Clostridiales bacterium]
MEPYNILNGFFSILTTKSDEIENFDYLSLPPFGETALGHKQKYIFTQ